jgi:hypothetical protein
VLYSRQLEPFLICKLWFDYRKSFEHPVLRPFAATSNGGPQDWSKEHRLYNLDSVDMSIATRFLVARTGFCGDDSGAKVIARVLRQASIEVSYAAVRQTPEQQS